MGLPVGDWGAETLVWVQRKNGSWWPGRVVETNDLSPSPPVHGRAATPIKLLGRDDATVDWYNVEKSKRIKAFRCGEFDDCIERVESRAESSPANFPKKIVKYARREGAILQALELEKQEVQKKHKAAGKERPGIICQAKRSRRVYLPADSNNCWKRTAFSPELLKVSSSTFEVHECPQQSGSAEDDASSRSMESDPTEKDSRGPGRVQKGTQLSDAAIILSSRTSNSGKYGGQTGNKNGKGAHELNSLADDPPESRLAAPDLSEQKWELKGKENICNLTRRRGDAIEIRSVKFKKDMAKTPCQSARRSSYLEEPGSQCSDPLRIDFHNTTETTLTDVELTVQASFRQERVPLVSLMSRLNGKAIVGHLIDVEASDDSSSEILLARNHEIGRKLIGNGGSSMLQPAWRTSRRTPVCYVPQPPPPAPKDDGNPQAHQNPALLSTEARAKSLPPKEEFPRKPLKKPSLANQKRRTLSTFDTKQRCNVNCDELQSVSQGCMMDDGLLKPKDSLPTRVTCVPVKQVFSKLLVAVGGLQS